MKLLLYVPPFQVEGSHVDNIAHVKIGGLTLYQRARRSAQNTGFEEIVVASPKGLTYLEDALVKIPTVRFDYERQVTEIQHELADAMGDADACICTLDGMISPDCISIRPDKDVRLRVNGEETGIYFLRGSSVRRAIESENSIDDLETVTNEILDGPEKALYHRVLSREDFKIAQNILTRSLKKNLGRDADGIVAYFINRPCSLQISKRVANSAITPNMVTAIGLVIGLVAAGMVAFGGYLGNPDEPSWLSSPMMILGVVLWQISSMVDGIDGELARMRMSPSHSGEWFDTVADDVTNITFLLGLGYALGQLNPLPDTFSFFDSQGFHFPYFYISILVCILMVVAVGWFYREFIKMGIASHNHFEWGFESENKTNKQEEKRNVIRKAADMVAGGFAWIAKRDFYTFLIMLLVILGFNKIAFFVMLIGASFVGIGGIIALSIRAVRSSRKEQAQAQNADAPQENAENSEISTSSAENKPSVEEAAPETENAEPLQSDTSNQTSESESV